MDGMTTRCTVLGADLDREFFRCSSTGANGDCVGFIPSWMKSILEDAGWTNLFVRSNVWQNAAGGFCPGSLLDAGWVEIACGRSVRE